MTDTSTTRAAAAADILLRARRGGERPADLPVSCRPRSEAEAYAVQDAVAARLGPIAGWKVGASDPEAEPNCAPLLAVFDSPATLDPSAYTLRGIEAEIAFRFGADLPPRAAPYERSEVIAALATAHPAIEVCECRLADHAAVDPMSKVADNVFNGALIVGPAWDGWAELSVAAQPVQLLFDDAVVVERRGGNAAGDLMRLLVWLANHLSRRGYGLRRGQVVTTGSWTGVRPSGPATHVAARFPGIGEAAFVFGSGG
jgi:2-keto-4-pentenoate hydratase